MCSNTPGAGDRIVCTEGTASTDNIVINASSIDIDTSADSEPGVRASHSGTGNIDINITGTTATPSTIDTMGTRSQGISFELFQNVNGTGTVTLENTQITTQGEEARGIYGAHHGIGAVTVDLNPGVVIETSGFRADGVTFTQVNRSATEDATLDAQGIRVTVRGNNASGLLAQHYGLGKVVMDIRDSTIVAHGNFGVGIEGYRNDSSGDIDIDVVGGSATTGGYFGHGIRAWHDDVGGADTDTGNLEITTRNHAIETQGTDLHPSLQGTYAYGIYANNENTGNIVIDLGEGSSVITRGKNSHGIVAYQRHATSPGNIDITLDGSVTVYGADTQGVRVGTVSSSGVPSRMAPLDSDGYRLQKVTVNGPIRSTAEGVFLANGGRVVIGPEGSIASDSGIAIRATGTVPEDSSDQNNVIAAILPKLRVDFNLEGRQRVADAIGNGRIVNDDGETTIAVNGTVLHDGKTGATGETAANGAWDVTMRASSTILGRDFSVTDDFNEVEVRGAHSLLLMEEYAPRAALYESLPGLLPRLDAGAPVRRPDKPAWAQVRYGTGRADPKRSQTGASYDFDRIEVAVGTTRDLGPGVSGSLWLRRLQSEVKVDIPGGSGELELHGVGAGVQANWDRADGLHVSGELSWTDFDADATSSRHGELARDVGADLLTARLTAGVRLRRENGLTLFPRGWLWHVRAEVDDFTDAVGARVTDADESRSAAGLGMLAELEGSASLLYGSVDVEHVFAGEETVVEVSGERLASESERTRVWVGLGGQRQGERVTLQGGLRLADPGGDDQELSASVSVSGSF